MALTVVTRQDHADKRWMRRSSLMFAAHDSVIPLVADEVAAVALSMPMGFIPQGDQYVLVGIMGLAANQNLLVSSEGHWLSSYMPAAYRTGPFRLATDENGDLLLCVDDDTGLITEDPAGERFFEEDGQLAQLVGDTLSLLGQIDTGRRVIENICAALIKHALLEPWPIKAGEQNIDGVYRINETALNALSNEDFLELRQVGALPIAYSQLISMQNISTLHGLYATRVAEQTYKTSISETFNFSNL